MNNAQIEYDFAVETAEARNAQFIYRFSEDAARLFDCGFTQKEVKQMLCSLNYVKIWCRQPDWLFPAKKLPAGFKWSDGRKEKFKSKLESQIYTLLPVGDDLYIKGVAMAGMNIKDPKIVRIEQFREHTIAEMSVYFGNDFLMTVLSKFWKENGLRQGYIEPILKDLDEGRKKVRAD